MTNVTTRKTQLAYSKKGANSNPSATCPYCGAKNKTKKNEKFMLNSYTKCSDCGHKFFISE